MQKKILIGTLRRCVASPFPVRFASVKSSKPKCLADPCQDIKDTKLDILCKVAIVTGGGSGIGYAAAYELLNNGAKKVLLAHPDEKKGCRAAQCLCDHFGMNKALFIPCDIRCPKQFEDVFLNAKKACNKVDILLNNAGVLDDKNWESSLNTNVIGTLRGMLLAYKYMNGNNSVVINTCGTMGLSPWPNCPIFSASKHAIVTASRCFGHPFHYTKTNIRVIGLCPSFTDTPTWEKGVNNYLNDEWGKQTIDCVNKLKMQSASLVGRAMIHLIKYGKSGRIYVCDKGVLHRAAFPREEDVLVPEPLC
ncbi:hypothetical protein RUM43_013405 [Polyplax serrata]|uniref:Uncharacterized protein n=1 Tax=Polyplax serrata TaxID=468196 RepID=A0AAN8S3V1_POLSC